MEDNEDCNTSGQKLNVNDGSHPDGDTCEGCPDLCEDYIDHEDCCPADCEDCAADAAEFRQIREDFEREHAAKHAVLVRSTRVLAWLYVAAIVSCIAAIIVDLATRVW